MENISLDNFQQSRSLNVAQLQLNGFISKHGVANFLNIPFAQFPGRFRTAKRLDLNTLTDPLDASRYGPRCPQKIDNIHPLMHNMFEKLSTTQRCDETTCLHLNVYAPPTNPGSARPSTLPVFVWIHGGGFNNGDNTTEFDGNHLVRRSMDLGKPIIIVTLNYRVNVFGFMSSKELIEEATSLGETPVLNQGLNDQRLGLEWIQNSIHHFGGDAAQVTIAGESAGAASVLCHLKGGRALFKQAMIQSSPIPRLRTLEEAQTGFDKLVKSAGIPTDAAAPEKLAALRALSADQLLELFDGSVSMPIIDPEWFAEHNRATLRSPSFWARFPDWCSQVILGHTKDEAALFLTPFQTCPDEELVEFVHSLAPDVGDQVLFADGKRPLEVITQWATQESFIRPCVEMLSAAAGYGHTVYGYEIAVVDPFPGTLHGFSWHSFGVPLTFYQPPGRIYPEIATTQDKLSAALVDFFYGREPWEAFNVEGRKICWDGEQSRLIKAADSVRSTDTTMSTGTDQKGHGIPAETGMGIIAAALKMQTS